jgi:hypothetical protein
MIDPCKWRKIFDEQIYKFCFMKISMTISEFGGFNDRKLIMHCRKGNSQIFSRYLECNILSGGKQGDQ